MKKIIATSIFGQFGQNLYQNMRKDFKCVQRPQAAFGRPKYPVAVSGRLKILYDYISNNSKILLDTIWIMYSICDKQKILETVFFLKYPYITSPTLWYLFIFIIEASRVGNIATCMTTARKILETFFAVFLSRKKGKKAVFRRPEAA